MAEPTPRQFEGSRSAGGSLSITPKTSLKEPRVMTKFNKENPIHVNLLKQAGESGAEYNKNSMQGSEELAMHPGGYFSMSTPAEKKTESRPVKKAVAESKRVYKTKKVSSAKPKPSKAAPEAKRKSNIELAQERELSARKSKLIK